ncbi:MAG: DUF364 domain-containing protein [Syntrophomonadaceae bacterium]|nr:DUF364 domain-containing protein [Syntrophomonadaceae bacterium]MDD3898642.1 DUF364 domain-containing protein [Syntrophomonadaceae bacterium]
MWKIYDELIDLIPEDLFVLDCMVGLHWTLIRSEKGLGAAMTLKGGQIGKELTNIIGMPLKDLAAYGKSWNMLQASLGMAAINSVLNTPGNIMATTGWDVTKMMEADEANAFSQFLPEIAGKRVAVIGHFPNIESLSRTCHLSVIERVPQSGDYPDPASEYILPLQDYVFITGTAFINKTMPRLLELSRSAKTILVGPSVPITPILFNYGVEAMAGMVILDEKSCWQAGREGGKTKVFKQGGQMVCIRR